MGGDREVYGNKGFRKMIIVATVVTIAASLCGYAVSGLFAFFMALVLGIVLISLFVTMTRRRYDDIAALNSYLEKVLAGSENPGILDQEEGELSILKTNIYKTTSTLYYQKELLSKDKVALSNAIADISHQLKTPLTSMFIMNELLAEEENNEKRSELLQIQSKQLDRMNWLIQTLLKLSKIDAGTITMNPTKISVLDVISQVMGPFEIQMDIKNIEYNQTVPDMSIKCDKNWTIEAIQNIVKNCIEHMECGGKLSINVSDTNIYSEIAIEDTGCGIAEADLPHIFERFYKGRNSGKDSVGIGLALAKTIITNQHGDILVESTEGVGSRFLVRFYKTII